MSPKKKVWNHSLELAVTWMSGLLVLFIANTTLFRYYGASVGDPWFNYLLAAVILTLVAVVTVKLRRYHKDVLLANSRIKRVDGMNGEQFAQYISGIGCKEGWSIELGPTEASGTLLYLDKDETRMMAVLHTGKRKLTRDSIAAAWTRCRKHESAAGGCNIWYITNSSFTSQARKEAAGLDIHLMDRRVLIESLAKTPVVPLFPAPAKKTGKK
jgi:hypothetical protein